MRSALLAAALMLAGGVAHADHGPDPLDSVKIVFARGAALFTSTAKGRDEAQLVALPETKPVRALRTDPAGKVLLADVGGKWYWMPLDGTATALAALPCGDGPAQLAGDAKTVLCKSKAGAGSVLYKLSNGKSMELPAVPIAGARAVGSYPQRQIIWADADGVWSANTTNIAAKTQLAKQPPLRYFLPAPDGKRALGVYSDTILEGKTPKPADWLEDFLLDGSAVRRKSMRTAVPLEWAHDSEWVLMQEGTSACIVRAIGGQYKCWAGYTAVAVSQDGEFALVLGDRDRDKKDEKKGKKDKKSDKKKDSSNGGEGADESSSDEAPTPAPDNAATDPNLFGDVLVAPPTTGNLALYRTKLDGPYSEPPALIISTIDGAAVVIPTPPAPKTSVPETPSAGTAGTSP